MHETDQELDALQQLLAASYARAGSHLRYIWGEETRLDARELCEELTGVQVLDLATVTPRTEPRVAPVDGLFYRGRLWFGSSGDSMRFRHIRARPQVSASVTHGESFALVVHGTAREVSIDVPEQRGFRDYLIEVYGPEWETWYGGESLPYAWIEAERMFTFGGVTDE